MNVKERLMKAELDLQLKRPMPNEPLERIRGVFCFWTLTGQAFTDVDHLRPEHITTDENSTLWIHKPWEKTAVVSRIPLLPHPIRILQNMSEIQNCDS